jgi:tetratricopeptide (TPR) repeat protein
MGQMRGFYNLFTVALLVGSILGFVEPEKTGFWSRLQTEEGEAAELYRQGREALDGGDWDRAIEAFEQAMEADEARADAALYWIAYAQNKLGENAEALDTLRKLRESYPDSRWSRDANALAVEIRGASRGGRGSELDEDLELKLMALNSLMHADEEQAVPLLEEFMKGNHPTKLKERALFVLAQSGSSRAFEIVAVTARNDADPELQAKAIQYLGIHGGSQSLQLLSDLYASLDNREAKKKVLQGFMMADEQDRLLQVAREETDPELRGRAVHLLGTMEAEDELWELYENESSIEVKKKILHALSLGDSHGRLLAVARDRSQSEELRLQAVHALGVSDATEELWTLYQEESSIEVKKRILHGLFLSDDVEKIAQVARNSSESTELREAAIHNLGLIDDAARSILLEIYSDASDRDLRKQVLHSLFLQDAAGELIDIARKETDSELKKQAVHWITLSDSDEAKAFLMEILRK